MSSVLHPVGPESSGTYWLRRVLLVAFVIVLILLVAHECSGGASTGGPSANAQLTTPPTDSTTPAGGHKPAKCATGALHLALATDAPTYRVGQTPRFLASIRNTGAIRCHFMSGAAREIWTVTSGKDRVWTTSGCVQSHSLTKVTLRPHAVHPVAIVWDAHRRSSSCVTGTPATAGTYVLSAVIDGLHTTPVVFRLTS